MQNGAPSILVACKSNNEREHNKRQAEVMTEEALKNQNPLYDKFNSALTISHKNKKQSEQHKVVVIFLSQHTIKTTTKHTQYNWRKNKSRKMNKLLFDSSIA